MVDAVALIPDPHGKLQPHERWRAVAALAGRQHGVVALAQLVQLGLGRGAIEYALKCRRLHRVYHGVYAIGHRVLTPGGARMAAVLAGGEGAVASHSTAADAHGLRGFSRNCFEITIPRRRHRRRGIEWHFARLWPDEITSASGIPVTTVPRTILDSAATRPRRVVERMIHEAEVNRLTDRLSLPDLLARYPRRPGTPTVKAILSEQRIGVGIPKSVFEDVFFAFLDDGGFPRPERNVHLTVGHHTYEIDCLWRSRRVALELDGRAAHDTAKAFEADRAKDRRLTVAGWRPVRVTWRQLHDGPQALASDLTVLLAPA